MGINDEFDINKKIKEYYSSNKKDKYRNNYHFQPPFGLINDPNGLSYFNNEYNIFFQWNPFSCEHKYKHWGFIKTKDFITYTIPKIALEPKDYYNKNGCYSGSAIKRDEKLEFLYTGNVKKENGERKSYQCRAQMDLNGDLKEMGPVISEVPSGYTQHFRDPKVYFKHGKYYFVIGAQTNDLYGRVLLYSSLDFKNWELEGEIKTSLNDFGYMWECPNIINLNGKDILMFCPQGLKKQKYKWQNIYQSGYIIGDFNYNTLNFEHGDFYELDKGFDFYAPQVFADNGERVIMIGWMGVPEEYENQHMSIKENWLHCLTMPRELTLKNNKIYQRPVKEVESLRIEKYFEKNNFAQQSLEFFDINKNSYEIMMDLNITKTFNMKIEMFKGIDEYFELNVVKDSGFISRENMKDGPKGIRRFKLTDINDNLKINIFVDKSAIEIYINDGEVVLSTRLFARENSLGLKIQEVDTSLDINEMVIWTLKGFEYI